MSGLSINEMTRLPWTWEGPLKVLEDGATHYELRIRELPDFFLAAESESELMRELKPAMRAFLQSYLERGEQPPLPEPGTWEMFPVRVGRAPETLPRPPIVFA